MTVTLSNLLMPKLRENRKYLNLVIFTFSDMGLFERFRRDNFYLEVLSNKKLELCQISSKD